MGNVIDVSMCPKKFKVSTYVYSQYGHFTWGNKFKFILCHAKPLSKLILWCRFRMTITLNMLKSIYLHNKHIITIYRQLRTFGTSRSVAYRHPWLNIKELFICIVAKEHHRFVRGRHYRIPKFIFVWNLNVSHIMTKFNEFAVTWVRCLMMFSDT